MKSHRGIRKHLYDYLRGELSPTLRSEIEAHLASCDGCRHESEAIREATSLLDRHSQRPSEKRGELYWQQFAAKVERRIDLEEEDDASTSVVRQLLDTFLVNRKPFSVGFASALMVMMIAFGVWSVWFKTPPPRQLAADQTIGQPAPGTPGQFQNVSVESRAQDYLEQSKVLLIGLMNTDTKTLSSSKPLLRRQQEISRRLVSESTVLTSSLNDPSQRQLKELISDLQLILLQIANLGTDRDLPGVEIIKGGIEHNGIIFKINLEEIQRATRPAGKTGGAVKKTI